MKTTDQIAAEAEQQIEAIVSMRWGEPHHGDIHEAVRQVIKAAIEKATEILQNQLAAIQVELDGADKVIANYKRWEAMMDEAVRIYVRGAVTGAGR